MLVRYWDFFSGEVFSTINLRDNRDLFGRMILRNDITFLDANRMLRLDFDLNNERFRIEGTKVIDIIIKDDLSSLTSVEALVIGGER